MTGSTKTEGLRPQESSSLPSTTCERFFHPKDQQHRRNMTPVPPAGQQMQLTPLWEHVVRTHRFPSEIDIHSTFVEISERLRDPEWEVRQHALRVLMDVMPTLTGELVDKVMQPVVPELINNLGHPAPAVRKGALDALRIYLLHSSQREEMTKNILYDGLNRRNAHDTFQTNVITGAILSAPSLLFPSASSLPPSTEVLKCATFALASRLSQVTHQEAVLKSLMKIRDTVGAKEFDHHLAAYDDSLIANLHVLCKVYNVKPSKKSRSQVFFSEDLKKRTKRRKEEEEEAEEEEDFRKKTGDAIRSIEKSAPTWESDSDTSGIAEEDDDVVSAATIPQTRVVLETEIKFDEETAITMTILEEKDDESEEDEDDAEESGTDLRNEVDLESVMEKDMEERRKTPRRVRFGGEIVKLRTPDSDDTDSIVVMASPKTRIPLPVFPVRKMPSERARRSSSQPCSPHLARRRVKRDSRSVSSSPKREIYVHNADLSPKKSILSSSNPVFVVKPNGQVYRDGRKGENVCISKDKESKDENIGAAILTNDGFQNMDRSKRTEESNSAAVEISNDEKDVEGKTECNKKEEVSAKEEKINREEASPSSATKDDKIEENKIEEEDITPRNDDTQRCVTREENCDSRASSKQEEKSITRQESAAPETISTSRRNLDTNQWIDSFFGSKVTEETEERSFDVVTKIGEKTNDSSAETIATMREVPSSDGESKNADKEESCSGSKSVKQTCQSTLVLARETVDDNRPKENAEGNESVTCSSSESEDKSQEASWEELGLVNEEVLNDLHNKEDWRARVRGLERVASALRSPSALIAIEPRLGSLLHAVLGGERSCRVAAAGLAVAKVIVAGIKEEALKRRLPLLAWGLARQGGPNAAQLARIVMLRLKPALLLEQFLQPQCLGARNAKTRENALQLLIFSLVTFPSTEFKVGTVAHKVSLMVGDRRRRVRQAALDALAVLAQIYEAEEIIQAGKRASVGRHDGEVMFSAIRARLARKSLPLVSADGLVVYGLQISPNVQIATGPDVDWIVAGSGSVSPGTGRSRSQFIAITADGDRRNVSRNRDVKNDENPWKKKHNFVARETALRSKNEPPVAWQIIPQNHEDVLRREDTRNSENRNVKSIACNGKINQFSNLNRQNVNAPNFSKRANTLLNREFLQSNLDENTNINDITVKNDGPHRSLLQENTNGKIESRIPVLFSRGVNAKLSDASDNQSQMSSKLGKNTKQNSDSRSSRVKPRETFFGSYEAMYQRRKRLQQDLAITTAVEANQNFNSHNVEINRSYDIHRPSYRAFSCTRPSTVSDNAGERQNHVGEGAYQNYQKLSSERNARSSDGHSKCSRANSLERRKTPTKLFSAKIPKQQTSTFETSDSTKSQKQFVDAPSFTPLDTSPCLNHANLGNSSENDNTFVQPRIDRKTRDSTSQKNSKIDQLSAASQTNRRSDTNSPFRRRIRSLSPSQLHQQQRFIKLNSVETQKTSTHDSDKAPTNEEEYNNKRNKDFFFPDANVYTLQTVIRKDDEPYEDTRLKTKSAGSSSSDVSASDSQRRKETFDFGDEQKGDSSSNNNSVSSIPQSPIGDKAFDVISNKSNIGEAEIVDSDVIPLDPKEESDDSIKSVITSDDDDLSKSWSSEDELKSDNRTIDVLSKHAEILQKRIDALNSSDSLDTADEVETKSPTRRKSIVSILSNERIITSERIDALDLSAVSSESLQTNYNTARNISPKHCTTSPKSDTYSHRLSKNSSFETLDAFCSPKRSYRSPKSANTEARLIQESTNVESSIIGEGIETFENLDREGTARTSTSAKSPVIYSSSSARPRSNETRKIKSSVTPRPVGTSTVNTEESTVYDVSEEKSINANTVFGAFTSHSESFTKLDDLQDDKAKINVAVDVPKLEKQPAESTEFVKRMPSKVPRSIALKHKTASNRSTIAQPERSTDKYRPIVQQCFSQLENKDWEVVLKGLKSLSQISKQHPEYLDMSIGGTIGHLLARHIKSLRSQVARAACTTAGDIFSSQIRGIDQDIDDIAGPLLHRTADTNRFLRADCNAALDRMVEFLPAHKIIGIIVQRGATHQNSIVRAATARLLSAIVDRVGPEHAMMLPRDVKEKLLTTGAKLLIDGNLDARNHAKKMFRQLIHCEGFHKALVETIPETTLRHIDKTLKSL